MRLHVTGASGFLGRELVAVADDVTTERADVLDSAALLRLFERIRPEVVIHTAYRQNGPDAYAITATGAGNVARASAAVGARLVHLSTDVVFDGRLGRPYVESDPPSPCTDYGRAKAEAERLVAKACPDALMVRTSLIVGGPRHEPSKHELVAADPAMTFYDDEIRNPIQVTDLAKALLELATGSTTGIVHVAGSEAVSRADLARLIVGRPVRCARAPVGRPLDCRLATERGDVVIRSEVRGVSELFGASGFRSQP